MLFCIFFSSEQRERGGPAKKFFDFLKKFQFHGVSPGRTAESGGVILLRAEHHRLSPRAAQVFRFRSPALFSQRLTVDWLT